MTNSDVRDFIGVYNNVYTSEFCKNVIERFEIAVQNGYGHTRQERESYLKIHKDDTSLFTLQTRLGDCEQEFNNVFWDYIYPDYSKKYDILRDSGAHCIYENKVQRSDVGQGYHVWHYESAKREVSHRLLAYTLYLNTVDEGGETEFLYYPRRVKPIEGTFLIWPASFTHTHRGNPPLSNTKYIMTGWLEF